MTTRLEAQRTRRESVITITSRCREPAAAERAVAAKCESHRVLAPAPSRAHAHGYRAARRLSLRHGPVLPVFLRAALRRRDRSGLRRAGAPRREPSTRVR